MDKLSKKAGPTWSPSHQTPPDIPEFAHSEARKAQLQNLARLREAHPLVYLDNKARSAPGLMRHLFEHLRATHGRAHERICLVLFVCRSPQAHDLLQAQQTLERALRIMALLREYSREVEVLIPQVGFGLATLLALGADRVLMHPMASLGNVAGADLLATAQHFLSLANAQPGPDAAWLRLTDALGPEKLGAHASLLAQIRETIDLLIKGRVQPRQEASLQAAHSALDAPTCPLARTLDRRRARELLALPLDNLDVETEAALWELFCAYEHTLGLGAATQTAKLSPTHTRPSVVLESAGHCHAWYPGEGKLSAPGWRALHDSALH